LIEGVRREMTNLIIGGAGFIGKNLVRELLSRNEDVIVLDKFLNSSQEYFGRVFPNVKFIAIDACDVKSLQEVVRKIKPTSIFHLAANSDIQLSASVPEIDIKETFLTTFSICRALHEVYVPNLFFASSSAVYGPKEGNPVESDSKIPISAYGWMKLASEEVLIETAKQGQIEKLTIFRFPNVTGQFMTHGVVFDLVRKLRRTPETLQVLGNGSQLKPFVLASELSKYIYETISLPNNINILNISNNQPIKISRIAELLAEKSGKNPEIQYSQTREGWKGDVPEYDLDCLAAVEHFGPLQFSPSEEAIVQAIDWELESFFDTNE